MKQEAHFWKTQESWRPPPELGGSTPRRLQWTAAGKANLILTWVIIVIGFAIVSAISEEAREQHALKQYGKQADGIVTRKWSESGRSMHYHMAYQFSADGRTMQ